MCYRAGKYTVKIHCFQARLCIFQPGNCTGQGSEGVKHFKIQLAVLPLCSTATLKISQGHQNIHVSTDEVKKVIITLAVGTAFQTEKDRSSSVFKIKENQEDFS